VFVCAQACTWLLEHLCEEKSKLRDLLLACNTYETREKVAALLKHVIKVCARDMRAV
jgi:hypothetical protein